MARCNQYMVSEAQSQCNDNEPPTVTSTEQVSYTIDNIRILYYQSLYYHIYGKVYII